MPSCYDALAQRRQLSIGLFRGNNQVRHGRAELLTCQRDGQEQPAQAPLRSGVLDSGGPVEFWVRCDECSHIACPAGALPQLVTAEDRQDDKIILCRQRCYGPAMESLAYCPAPQFSIVEVERHNPWREPRGKPSTDPAA